MSIDDLLRDLARALTDVPEGTARELREQFIRACRRVDDDPREQQRIDDIADLLDAEETLYAQARAAADRGDTDTAVPLLRQCAEAGTGEAAWLLAQLLEDLGNTSEAMAWYQHARDDGDTRADEKLAALRARPSTYSDNAGNPREDHAAAAIQGKPVILDPAGYDDSRTRPDLALIAAAADPADPASGLNSFFTALVTRLVQQIVDPCDTLTKRRILRIYLSTPDSDHFGSLEDLCAAVRTTRNHLAHDPSWDKAFLVKKLQAREWISARDWVMASFVVSGSGCVADKSRTAAWALDSRWACEDYDRICLANLGRLYMAGQWDARRRVREPVVADMMLPPSEVPECGPDTTLIEALERLVQSGTQALPVCEKSRVVGIVTLADLARHINDHHGVPSVTEDVHLLMRPATIVPTGTPLPAIAQAIADDGIIVVSGPGDRPVGYLTAESVLTQAPPGTSTRPTAQDHPPLLIPGTGAVLLNRCR